MYMTVKKLERNPRGGRRALRLSAACALVFAAICAFFPCAAGADTAGTAYAAAADEERVEETEKELSDAVGEQLDKLNLSEFEKYLSSLSAEDYALFGGGGFKEKLRGVINGDFKIGYDSFFAAALNLLFGSLTDFIPLLAAIAAVALLYSIIYNARSDTSERGTGKIVHFACISVVIIIVTSAVVRLVFMTRASLTAMQTQMNITFPVLLTLMTALGGAASAAVYQPATAVLSQLVTGILLGVILPLFLLSLVFNAVGNLSDNVKLDKMPAFLSSLSKSIIGVIFTVFTAFLTIQGITAGAHDSVSIRTAKFAISNYVPLIGGYLSDGFNLILAGTMLIKNAVGFSCVLLLIISVLRPVIAVTVFSLGLRLLAAILEPAADAKISGFLTATAKSLNMLTVVLLAAAFMYFITLMLIIGTGNRLLG